MSLLRLLPTAALLLTLGAPVGSSTPLAGAAPAGRDLAAFTGLSTWVDGYDFALELTSRPKVDSSTVARMRSQGVRTIWLQAAKASPKVRGDLMSPDRAGAILRAAHARGIRVVAWYLPRFHDPATDWRKLDALLQFRAGGHMYDGFALDIEDTRVPVATRNARLVALSRRLRKATVRPVAAVVLPPVLTEVVHPGYWDGTFPWVSLRSSYDLWVPMGYYTAYSRWPRWRDAATSTTEDIRRIRSRLGARVPVAYAGGLGADSTRADLEGFTRAARAQGALGVSVYDYATTPGWAWPALRAGAPPGR
jgi:hypothetical protein